ncbi:hypothetical protein R6Z07F_009277 [Ovis aries]
MDACRCADDELDGSAAFPIKEEGHQLRAETGWPVKLIHNYATFYGSFLQKVTQSDAGTPFVWIPVERQQFNENKEARPQLHKKLF